jgi:NADH dehydrogenase FAD-containing subunit
MPRHGAHPQEDAMRHASRPERRPHVVLVGAGHVHLHAIRRAADYARSGVDLTLIAPEPFRYSGMASGVLAGTYDRGANEIDVGLHVARAGGRVLTEAVAAIDPPSRTVRLQGSGTLRYDMLSLATGSQVVLPAGGGAEPWTVKPVLGLAELRDTLEAGFARGDTPSILIVGGGASGCEIAACTAGLAHRHGARVEVTLIHDGARVFGAASVRASEALRRALERRGVRVRLGERAERIDAHGVTLADGRRRPADFVIAATGLRAPPLIAASGLPAADDGALLVEPTLCSIADPRVFAGGDSAALAAMRLPRVGVHAVRQGPVLHHNLLAAVTGRPLRTFTPQRAFLLILNLGDGTAFATRGRLHWHGRVALWLKDRIDRRFLQRYAP